MTVSKPHSLAQELAKRGLAALSPEQLEWLPTPRNLPRGGRAGGEERWLTTAEYRRERGGAAPGVTGWLHCRRAEGEKPSCGLRPHDGTFSGHADGR